MGASFLILPLMNVQVTDTLLMVRPTRFGYNVETESSNIFQRRRTELPSVIAAEALKEFDELVKKIREKNIFVIVLEENREHSSPDAIFPNNWISFHGRQAAIYPMKSPSRRQERKKEWIQFLSKELGLKGVHDFSLEENKNQFLEGTGSLVLDRINKVAYANISLRTSYDLAQQWAGVFDFDLVSFHARSESGQEIYHTNILLSIGKKTAVVCSEVISKEEKQRVLDSLGKSHEVVEISYDQMLQFAGNILLVQNRDGKYFWIMSGSAERSLSDRQKNLLLADGEFLSSDLEMIESTGGGSARCMIAEVFHQL